MKKLLISLLIIGMVFYSGCTSQTEYQTGDVAKTKEKIGNKVEILNHKMEYGEYGNLMVVGTAKNVGDRRLSYVEIRVKFYDKDGVLLETFLDNIADVDPGQVWKFEVLYPSIETENVDHYEVGVGTVW